MKVMTILGTRPEIIRLARIIEKLDHLSNHTLVHTGQNFDVNLSDIFFSELGIRKPDHYLGAGGGSFGAQMGQIIASCEELFLKDRPDRLLVLGDTNSGLSVVPAKRMGIPVFHMEAGNRCFDDRVPEEVNRRIIDHSSDILMPYTERSRQNLLAEGIPSRRIFVTGNPIWEVIQYYRQMVGASQILASLSLKAKGYFIVTMHRAENVDSPERLRSVLSALSRIADQHKLPIIVSTHPRTRLRMEQFGIASGDPQIRFLQPFGFPDFLRLEQDALCVITDSGTVQEECSILKVPNVTIRDSTERPETVESGSNIISGVESDFIVRSINMAIDRKSSWKAPAEYLNESVSDTVVNILLSFIHEGARFAALSS
jgi:UDP-N-acetylglucosamine 2-epimerase (non-hydrolysing)